MPSSANRLLPFRSLSFQHVLTIFYSDFNLLADYLSHRQRRLDLGRQLRLVPRLMWMAPTGHSAAQMPQPRQTSRCTSGFPSVSATAPKGQSSTHARQRRQSSGVIMATSSPAKQFRLEQNPGGPDRRGLGLGRGFPQALGIVGHPAEKHAFGGRIHRAELLMGLLEPPVQGLGDPQLPGQALAGPRAGSIPVLRTTRSAARATSWPKSSSSTQTVRGRRRAASTRGGRAGLKGNERHPPVLGLDVVSFPGSRRPGGPGRGW